jgi:hypothetical protein
MMANLLHDFFSTPAFYSQSKSRANLTPKVLPSSRATLYSMHNFLLSTHNDPNSCHNSKLPLLFPVSYGCQRQTHAM